MGKLRKCLYAVVFWGVCFWLLLSGGAAVLAKTKKTYDYMEAEAKQITFTKVKLVWPKHKKIEKVVIYGGLLSKGLIQYDRKVKVLDGTKTSVTLPVKRGKKYGWRIEAVRKKSGNRQRIWFSEVDVWTDVSGACFDDYQYYEGETTPTSIRLRFYLEDGIRPDGLKLSRRPVAGGAFEVVKEWNHPRAKSCTDKTVEPGQGYEYRIRAWKLEKGKRVYGSSDQVVMYAVNHQAKLTLAREKTDGDGEILILDSDPGNGEIVVKSADLRDCGWLDRENNLLYSVEAYSTDGVRWNAVGGKGSAVIPAGGRIRFRISARQTDGKRPEDYEEYGGNSWMIPAAYHGQRATYLLLDLPGGQGWTTLDLEAIH